MRRFFLLLGAIFGGALATGPIWGVIAAIVVIIDSTQHLGHDDGKNFDIIVRGIIHGAGYLVLGIIAWPVGATLCAYCIARWKKPKPEAPPPLPVTEVPPPPVS